MKNTVYDRLKFIALFVLPAAATLVFAITRIWGLPYGAEIAGTISAIDTFLGAVLGISTSKYKGDGTLTVGVTETDELAYQFQLNQSIDDLYDKDRIVLKVNHDD